MQFLAATGRRRLRPAAGKKPRRDVMVQPWPRTRALLSCYDPSESTPLIPLRDGHRRPQGSSRWPVLVLHEGLSRSTSNDVLNKITGSNISLIYNRGEHISLDLVKLNSSNKTK